MADLLTLFTVTFICKICVLTVLMYFITTHQINLIILYVKRMMCKINYD